MGPGGINLNGKPIKKNLNNNVGNNVVNNNMINNINNNNNNFNQGKYVSGNVSHHNQSQSPASQTFFKDNSSKNKNNNSLIGKKGWPSLKKKNNGTNVVQGNNMYISPYNKNPNPKRIGGQGNNTNIGGGDINYATSDERG